MSKIGELSVEINADTSGLDRGTANAESRLSQLGRRAAATAKRLALITTAAAATGAALVANLTRQGLQAIDTQAKLARSLDATADGLRAVQIASERAGVPVSQMETSAQQLNQRLAEAARTGAGPAADALDRLGLSADELMRLDVDERMAVIADRMHDLGFSSAQAQDELRQLGIRSREMSLLMTQGGDAIRDARQDVDDFGLSLSEVDTRTVERANDAMADIGRIVDVVRQRLAVALAPVIEMISSHLGDAARESGGFADAIDRGVELGVRGFALLSNAIAYVQRSTNIQRHAFVALFNGIAAGASAAAAALIERVLGAINTLIEGANRFSRIIGVEFDQVEPPAALINLQNVADESSERVRMAAESIREELGKPLPRQGILEAYEKAVEASQEASEREIEEAERRSRMLADRDQHDLERQEEKNEEEEELDIEAMQRRMDRLRQHLMDQEELEHEQHQHRLEELARFHQAGLMSESDYANKVERLTAQHEARMQQMRERSAKSQTDTARQAAQDMFGQSKAASLANAALDAKEAITGAYKVGARIGGPPVGAAFAATAAAFQARQIRDLQGTTFSGGSSAGAGVGGASVAPPAAQPAGGGGGGGQDAGGVLEVRGIGAGDLFTGEAVRTLAERLVEFQQDGGRVVFDG